MRYRIFITEDDKVTALFIRHALEKEGYIVEGVAHDAETAIDQIRKTSPDLVLMDISLPGKIDGVKAAEILKTERNIPVIYATGTSDEETVQRVLASDPNGYVLKPIVPVQLYTTIETAMQRYQLENKLTDLNEHLESKVEERTKELESNNRLLEAEIDRRKTVENNLKEALAKEKELNELKTRIVSIVSHEFKTPLTTILSSTQLVDYHLKKFNDIDKITRHTSTIIRSVKNLTNILNDTLFISKTETQSFKLEPSNFNLVEVIQDIWKDLKIAFAKEHEMVLTVGDNFPKNCFQDEKLLKQAIQNLFTNAVKYSPRKENIYVTLSFVNNEVVIAVRDEGMGIPKKDFKLLFEMFHRASNVENIEGTGVGLVIVKRTMDMIGGSVRFKSEEKQGTEFILNFPPNFISKE